MKSAIVLKSGQDRRIAITVQKYLSCQLASEVTITDRVLSDRQLIFLDKTGLIFR
jgi:hypothetical protein